MKQSSTSSKLNSNYSEMDYLTFIDAIWPKRNTIRINNDLFIKLCSSLKISPTDKDFNKLVVYNMTDGMRTSTNLDGVKAYIDGGIFVLKLITYLQMLGAKCCYINVIDEKHQKRENFINILTALNELVTPYSLHANETGVKYVFMGKMDETLKELTFKIINLETITANNSKFLVAFFMNYSLDWAMLNENKFTHFPDANIIIRHTKMQVPTGMLLPPAKSDYTTLVFAQQGSSCINWDDSQILALIAISLRVMMKNEGTQYSKIYSEGEKMKIRNLREKENYITTFDLRPLTLQYSTKPDTDHYNKRVISTTPEGPEIYEF